MDMLGYFVAKEGRKKLKRYQVINFEVVNSMDAEFLILCLRRFIGCRGNVRMLRSDNGNNFIRPDRETERDREREFSKGFLEMDKEKNKKKHCRVLVVIR